MNRGDANDELAPDAPLLSTEQVAVDDNPHLAADSQTLILDLRDSGSLFIWALTFSAGISGLLFGYE
jgi:SP family myo-inositol transporter-like MFS transporter 13